MSFIDLTGQKFGKLTAIKRTENAKDKHAQWICKCDCGNITIVQSSCLKRGHTKSCGCIRHEPPTNKTHGKSRTRLYTIWRAIIERCYNPQHKHYKNYGGRGIAICEEWLNDTQAFFKWAIESGYREDLTIDRIDANGNYEPSNCRWATRKEQANNRRGNHLVTYNGKIQTIAQLADEIGMDSNVLRARINNNWTIERAINTPIRKRG